MCNRLPSVLISMFIVLGLAASARAESGGAGTAASETPIAPKCEDGTAPTCADGTTAKCDCASAAAPPAGDKSSGGGGSRTTPSTKGKPGESSTTVMPGASATATGGDGGSVGNITIINVMPQPEQQPGGPTPPQPQFAQMPPEQSSWGQQPQRPSRLRLAAALGVGFIGHPSHPGPGFGGQFILDVEGGLRLSETFELVARPHVGVEVHPERSTPAFIGADLAGLYGKVPEKWGFQVGGFLGYDVDFETDSEKIGGPSQVRGWFLHAGPEARLVFKHVIMALRIPLGVGVTNWGPPEDVRDVLGFKGGMLVLFGGQFPL